MAASKRMSVRTQQNMDAPLAEIPLKVSVKNFGPISAGTIKLMPLTVLIGPSNSGKSYASRLTYCVARSIHALRRGFILPMDVFAPLGKFDKGATMYAAAMSDITNVVKKLSRSHSAAIPRNTVSLIQGVLLSPFPHMLAKELRHEFKSDLGSLVRFSASGFSISVSGLLRAHLEWPVKPTPKPQIPQKAKYWIIRDPDSGNLSLKTELDGKSDVLPLPSCAGHFDTGDSWAPNDRILRDLVSLIMGKIVLSAFPPVAPAFFFSLSQSPLLSVLGLSDTVADHGEHLHRLDCNFSPHGLPKDLLQSLLSIDIERPGQLCDLADMMEQDLFGGNIALTKLIHEKVPTISLQTSAGSVPLRLMSSHVSSLALLTICLKYLVAPGHRIIIEEPEAHMHPANQLKFAKYVALLIRRGVNVTLVTNSILIVERLSAYMMIGELDKKVRKKATSDPDVYLTLSEVSAHEFIAASNGNFTVRDLQCSKYDGMDQDKYGKLRFDMYNERLLIQRQIEGFADDPE